MPEKKLFTQDELNAAIAKAAAEAIANITPESILDAQRKRASEERERRQIESATNRINAFRAAYGDISNSPEYETLSTELKDALSALARAKVADAEAALERGDFEKINLNEAVFRIAKAIQTDERAARYESNFSTVNRLIEEVKVTSNRTNKHNVEAKAIEDAANTFLASRFATRA